MRIMPLSAVALLLAGAILVPVVAHAQSWTVTGFLHGKKDKPAEDLSGIACEPEEDDARLCLLIDDETQFAQWVTLKGGAIVAGALLPLISDHFDGKAVELDGEGAAFADGAFYVIGSFGAPRTGAPDPESAARLKADSHFFRIVPEGDSWQISDAASLRSIILADPDLKLFADHELADNGLTIEGVTVSGDTAYIGFRGPVLGVDKSKAAILSLPLSTLFKGAPLPAGTEVHKISLGIGKGVRDLATVGDDVLILAGPVGNEKKDHMAEGAYRLFRWSPGSDQASELLQLPLSIHGNDSPDKPEAVLPLGVADGHLDVLVLSDGPENGAPKSYRLDWSE
ncbi:Protein of unknown function [Kaistia soli DSM 19436]|uniref:DUF3616 domain-containing protein n=1 Tax=Kaistia soli DSM 19436 TaxID=1122133 RepID=A0A1M5PBX3_9HYPH|nr:DUF3616 domain-containing protein [Kaistia soli]SHG98723.1 Protein of unknown function [Kaistia soli DSM 19436]